MDMQNFFSAVKSENVQALLAYFHEGKASLLMPHFGLISNNRIFAMLVSKVAAQFGKLNVEVQFLGSHAGEGMLIAEYVLSYQFYDWEKDINVNYETPTALVCRLAENGKILFMNVYTQMDKFVGKEVIRPAFLQADPLIADALPSSVREIYQQEKMDTVTEPCRAYYGSGWIAVEENVLMTRGAVCTPQAQLHVFLLAPDGCVEQHRVYSEIVWDFKLWPTLF